MSKMNVKGKVVFIVNDSDRYDKVVGNEYIFPISLEDLAEAIAKEHSRLTHFDDHKVSCYYKFHRYDYIVNVKFEPIFSAMEVKRK